MLKDIRQSTTIFHQIQNSQPLPNENTANYLAHALMCRNAALSSVSQSDGNLNVINQIFQLGDISTHALEYAKKQAEELGLRGVVDRLNQVWKL